MNLRWLINSVILGALCVAPSILLRAQIVGPTSQPIAIQGQDTLGGKSDVDAVGSRNVGCSPRFSHFSVENQAAVGRSLAQQIELRARFVSDPVVTEYVNRIGQNIARNSDAQVPFTVKVIDSDVVNAMALPGGFLYINSGLLLAVDEEAEVAGIMAHEIAHVAACHAGRTWSMFDSHSTPSDPINPPPGGIDDMAGMFGILRFVRGFEAEADYLGIEYMYGAGYDPSALVLFFDKIHAMENVPSKPGMVARSFVSHPPNADRIEKLQKEIGEILPARQQYLVTNSDFDDVKARLAAIRSQRRDDSN